MSKYENEPAEENSRTHIRDEMTALQKLGEKLMKMAESQLDKIPLPDNLRQAIRFMRTLKSNEAKRRQAQYIGKLMRDVDPEPIVSALGKLELLLQKKTDEFHEIEKWRDRLIAEGDTALAEFLRMYPQVDRQMLRQLVRNAMHDRAKQVNRGHERELFRVLRSIISPED